MMDKNTAVPGCAVLFDRAGFDGNAPAVALGGLAGGSGYAIRLGLGPAACAETLLDCRNGEKTIFSLQTENNEAGERVSFTFYTRGEDKPFALGSPVLRGGAGEAPELLVWVSDVYAALFADGKLADEEWPLGGAAWTEPVELTVSPAVRYIVISGCERPDEAFIVPKGAASSTSRGMQYWRPEGHNTGVGDCMPFWHDGVFHLFYLFDRRRHKSKHGLGAHQWAHASSRDLVHWTHHEMAIPITKQWEGSICTGSAFYHDGVFYGFYSARMSDHSAARLSVSTSEDGLHFHKNQPLTSLKAPYDGPSARDPVVFRGGDGLFHMLVTTSLESHPIARRGGCLAHLTSSDLWHWDQQAPFIIPGYTDQPECADYFSWNGWNYLVFSNNGIARYRMSRRFDGPWVKPANDMLNCPNVTVPKTAEFHGGRRISVGFLHDAHQYASCTVFREIVQNPDGTLGSAFVPEMLAQMPEIEYGVVPLTGGVTVCGNTVAIKSAEGFSAAALTGLPRNKRMTLKVASDGPAFGLCLKSDTGYSAGTEFVMDPRRGKAGFRPCNDNSFAEYGHDSIYNLDLPDGPVTLDIVCTDNLIDVCIGSRRTIITKSSARDTDVACLFVHCGSAAFEDIKVMPL